VPYFGVRGFQILLVAVLVSIGIGVGIEAAGVASGPKPTFKSAVSSIGDSPYFEGAFTLATGIGRRELNAAVLNLEIASADGHTNLSALPRGGPFNLQVSLSESGNDLADLRLDLSGGISAIYARIFPAQIAKLPTLSPRDRDQLRLLDALVGGQWFSFPKGIVNALTLPGAFGSAPRTLPSNAAASAAEKRLENDLLAASVFTSRSISSGTETTVTIPLRRLVTVVRTDLGSLLSQSLGGAPSLGRGLAKGSEMSGTARLKIVTDSGDTLRAVSLGLVSRGKSVAVHAAVGHDPVAIGAPSGARPLPQSILGALGQLGGGRVG
jgi:hypothetical protein